MTHRHYGTIGFIGVGLFVLALIGLHILDSDLSVVDEYVSVYALGDYKWISRAADLAMGLGVIAIALGLRRTLAKGKRVTASWLLVLVAGFGFIVSGIFNTDPTNTTDPTTSGAIHDLGGYISILSLMIATWLLRGVFKRDQEYSAMFLTQTRFAVVMTGALAAFIAFESILGLTQRLFIAVVAGWLITLSISIRQTAGSRV